MHPLPPQFHRQIAELLHDLQAHPLPLVQTEHGSLPQAKLLTGKTTESLFPNARLPHEAHAGLLLLLRAWDESHQLAQALSSKEGSYWHAIAHRLEPDDFNSQYWFRRMGHHPIFEPLQEQAVAIIKSDRNLRWNMGRAWDPALFGRWCEEGRAKPNSAEERAAVAIGQAEWSLLFSWCARPSDHAE